MASALRKRVERLLRPHGHEDDLPALGLLDPERLLDGVQVGRVERRLAGAVEPLRRRVDPLVHGRIRHLLDADGDLHRRGLYRRPPPGASARSDGVSGGVPPSIPC
jgi:hypothetical protein